MNIGVHVKEAWGPKHPFIINLIFGLKIDLGMWFLNRMGHFLESKLWWDISATFQFHTFHSDPNVIFLIINH